ncbi:MAG: M3 family metallopeptidase [Desulfobacterales bacterium]|nr:M3 family metallopeptidase [Desulfobacterales bacterium]
MPARLPEIETDDGRKQKLTNSNFIKDTHRGQPGSVRKAAFQGYYTELSGNTATLAALLEGQVKAHSFRAVARSFPIGGCRLAVQRQGQHRGVRLAYRCGAKEPADTAQVLRPQKKDTQASKPWNARPLHPHRRRERQALHLRGSCRADPRRRHPLGATYVETLARGIENRWVDRYENAGKRSGAYSSGCYDSPPYMLLNFTGTLDSVFTLAHEAGHSMHSHYSRKNRSYQDSDYPIILAEVASITNEMLLFEHLSGKLSDRTELVGMLDHLVNSFRSTLFRQTMFAEFELLIHRHVEEGGILTPDYLNEQYFALVRAYHGDSFTWDDSDRLISTEWARVPHFYYDFYVYKYATGMAAAVAASEAVLSGRSDAYSAFLAGGRSKPPLEQLMGLGVDLESPGPVDTAVARFARTTDALEEALGQKG